MIRWGRWCVPAWCTSAPSRCSPCAGARPRTTRTRPMPVRDASAAPRRRLAPHPYASHDPRSHSDGQLAGQLIEDRGTRTRPRVYAARRDVVLAGVATEVCHGLVDQLAVCLQMLVSAQIDVAHWLPPHGRRDVAPREGGLTISMRRARVVGSWVRLKYVAAEPSPPAVRGIPCGIPVGVVLVRGVVSVSSAVRSELVARSGLLDVTLVMRRSGSPTPKAARPGPGPQAIPCEWRHRAYCWSS